MRSKTVLITLLLGVSFPIYATEQPPAPAAPDQQQAQNQSQFQTQTSVSEASASVDQANSQSLNVDDRRQAPASFAPAIAPTAPCYYSFGAALSFPGGSVGGGKAVLDEACQLREEIRLGYAIGLVAEARQLWCATAGKGVDGCGTLTAPPTPPDTRPTVVVLTGESCASNNRERVDRVLEKCVGK